MTREIKFKAKRLTEDKSWIDGFYVRKKNHHYIMIAHGFWYAIFSKTLCQLITKIGKIEIYEYDCWYNKRDNYYKLYEYDEDGHLYECIKSPNVKGNLKNWLRTEDDVFAHLQRFQFIGNWHDGEEYLLNKIKELGDERI